MSAVYFFSLARAAFIYFYEIFFQIVPEIVKAGQIYFCQIKKGHFLTLIGGS